MQFDLGACQVRLFRAPEADDRVGDKTAWQRAWQQVPPDFPLQQRYDWPMAGSGQHCMLLCLEHRELHDVAYVGLRLHRLRALPGAWYLQVPKLGVGLPHWALQATMSALRELAARWWRVARVRIELCLLNCPERLIEYEREARNQGYSVVAPLEYENTLVLPLPETSYGASAQFHRTVFKNTRKLERAGHVVRPIVSLHYAERLAVLYAETMSRTGARVEVPDMVAVIRSSAEQPERYRLLGLYRLGVENPESLMAFRWCGRAGRYAYDLLAASTRLVDESGQIPMMPAIMLSMFDWASESGATHFDFGGVVLDGDPRGAAVAGISRFKMQFGGTVSRVGNDLLLEPRTGWRVLDRARKLLR